MRQYSCAGHCIDQCGALLPRLGGLHCASTAAYSLPPELIRLAASALTSDTSRDTKSSLVPTLLAVLLDHLMYQVCELGPEGMHLCSRAYAYQRWTSPMHIRAIMLTTSF